MLTLAHGATFPCDNGDWETETGGDDESPVGSNWSIVASLRLWCLGCGVSLDPERNKRLGKADKEIVCWKAK